MPANDPSKALAREIANLTRRVNAMERGSQASRRSIEVNGESVSLPQVAATGAEALSTGTTALATSHAASATAALAALSADDAKAAAVAATSAAQEVAATAQAAQDTALEAAGIAAAKGTLAFTETAPVADPNTLWIKPPTNQPYRWNGTAWTLVQDASLASAAQGAKDAADRAIAAAADAQAAADGKVKTYFQDTAPTGLVAGDVGDLWYETDNGNKLSRWSGTAWVATTLGSAAISATARQLGSITTFYQGTAPTSGMVAGDLWVDTANGNKLSRYGTSWTVIQDSAIGAAAQAAANAAKAASDAATAAQTAQNIANAAQGDATRALTSASGKNTVTYSTSSPTSTTPGIRNGDIWWKLDATGTRIVGTYQWVATPSPGAWTSAVFGDAVLDSLSVGKLVAGSISAGQKIIAGDANGTHAEMSDTGFRVFAADPSDNIPNEAVRMGTTTNDFFGIVAADGSLLATVDDTGRGNFQDLNVDADPTFMGRKLSQWVGASSGAGTGQGGTGLQGAQHWYGFAPAAVNQLANGELGLVEMAVTVDAGRQYLIIPEVEYVVSDPGTNVELIIRDGGTGSPTLSSTLLYRRQFHSPGGAGLVNSASQPGLWRPSYTGQHRLLLSWNTFGNGYSNVTQVNTQPVITVLDLGPAKPIVASVNHAAQSGGGAPPPPPTQQYFVDLTPTVAATYNGASQLRTDTTDVIQGYDPSGFNGDGHGFWTFNVPSITGTVNRVDFYAYSNHWYYNSGGSTIMNIIKSGDGSNIGALKLRGDWIVGGWPKPGGVTLTLPSDWWPFFANSAGANRAIGVSLGKSGGTNLSYYGRFNGPDSRLRIWYTQ